MAFSCQHPGQQNRFRKYKLPRLTALLISPHAVEGIWQPDPEVFNPRIFNVQVVVFERRIGHISRSVGGDLAAVDVYGLAADPVALVGAEEDDGVGDVGSGAGSAHGDVRL